MSRDNRMSAAALGLAMVAYGMHFWPGADQHPQQTTVDQSATRLLLHERARASAQEWRGFVERGDLNRDGTPDRLQPMVRSSRGDGMVPAYQPLRHLQGR